MTAQGDGMKHVVTEWATGAGAAGKEYLSVPVAIRLDVPARFWLQDAITHERVSEVLELGAGAHAFTVPLTRPTRYVQWVVVGGRT